MNTTLYVGLSRQLTLQRALEIAANNIANIDTAGFKLEELLVSTEPTTPPATPDGSPIDYVLDRGIGRNFAQGALDSTGNAFDVGLDGDGFFQIQTAAGLVYTRDGRFTVNAANQLVTKAGEAVMDANGQPIVLDPRQPEPAIAPDGTVSQGKASKGKIAAYRFPDVSVLSKVGDNHFTAPAGVTPLAAGDTQMRQGMIERSNVTPVVEITNLIEITRAYERVAKMMDSSADLGARAVQRLGQAA